mmetsp:Transcript_30438/g.69688  ORF Transcript_30438/g.69688 Transcript_30438/m.69688 type:complete len:98 (+) Transcript_30438:1292-1585(+)
MQIKSPCAPAIQEIDKREEVEVADSFSSTAEVYASDANSTQGISRGWILYVAGTTVNMTRTPSIFGNDAPNEQTDALGARQRREYHAIDERFCERYF